MGDMAEIDKSALQGGTETVTAPNATPTGISFSAVRPVNISVRDLCVSIDTSLSKLARLASFGRKRAEHGSAKSTKTILQDVTGEMRNGTLTAIIGSSGSGKTSMLNVLSHRMGGSRLNVSGETLFNNDARLNSVRSSYVMQQDILIPTLTVRETLQYAADLRLPPPTSTEERKSRVTEVIRELGLQECADTRIGNDVHRGCSGGEKRRTSIGVQMLANPSVLFADEPTTGLDSTSAFQVVKTLKDLASRGRTVIITIHQPRSEIWSLFDNVVLLAKGSPVYFGSAVAAPTYFENLGYELPPFVNPAEHLIDLAAVDTRTEELEASSLVRVNRLHQSWQREITSRKETGPIATAEKLDTNWDAEKATGAGQDMSKATPKQTSLTRQVKVLTSRTFKVTLRDPLGVFGSLFESVGMAIIMGWIFLSLPKTLSGIRSREGALYTAAALQGYLILLYDTYRLTIDIELFDRERSEGVVSVTAFLISRRAARAFLEDLPVPLLFSTIFYFMAGFEADARTFFIFFAVTLLSQYIAVTFATLCVAVSRNFAGATLIGNMGYTLQSFACGFFVQSKQIPVYVRWLKWTAYVFYGFGALCSNEFIGNTDPSVGRLYDCPYPGGASNPACREYTGAYVMNSLGFPSDWIWRPILALLGFAVAFYIGAGVILRFWRVEVKVAQPRRGDSDQSTGKEKMTARSPDEVRTLNIRLENFALEIQKRNMYGKKVARKTILQPVTANFEPGVLNVIMGPSGSGKTSLLNSMAQRLHSSVGTEYISSGQMLYNGSVPSKDVIHSLTSYVCQDDDALLSSLTVRETLRFAAGLRLPKWMSKEDKHRRAEEVLLQLGLKDCADNIVGGELVKGISGGEARRVSIAIQILTDPRVLLVDEPTSG